MFKNLIIKTCNRILDKLNPKQVKSNVNNESIIINNKKVNCYNVNNIIFRRTTYIPKHIFFIYVGNNKPDYLEFTIKNFKDINYDYKIDLLDFTYDSFFKNKIVWEIIKEMKLDNKSNLSHQELREVLTRFKFKLLYTYGGIYCSNTIYCIKKLDDLLEYPYFVSTCIRNNVIYDNYCMFGVDNKNKNNTKLNRVYPPILYNTNDFETIKMSFYNCRLHKNMFVTKCNKLQSYIYDFGDSNYDT